MRFAVWLALGCFATILLGCGTDTIGDADFDAGPETGPADVAPPPVEASVDAPAPPSVVLPPGDIDFGAVDCGTSGGQRALVVRNGGGQELSFVATLETTGAFTIVDPAGGKLGPGESGVITIAQAEIPAITSAGALLQTTLTVSTNDPAHPTTKMLVKATASGAALLLQPASALFGVVPIGATQDLPLTLKNNGNKTVKLSLAPPQNAQFTLTWTGAPNDVSLDPGASVPGLTAHFSPTETATTATSAPIVVTGAVCGDARLPWIAMSGQGSSGAFAYAPALLDFGQVDCGTTAQPQSVTVTNAGNQDFTFATSLGRGLQSPYTVTISNATVKKNGGTSTITVTPKPIPQTSSTTDDLYGDTLTLTVTSGIPNEPTHAVVLRQTARGALIGFQPTSPIAFGDVPLGTSSTSPFTVTNSGNAPATITASITNGPPFGLTTTSLGVVSAGATANDTATFTPRATGLSAGVMSLAAAAGDVLCAPLPTLDANGTGTNGAIGISASSVSFGQVACGTAAPPQSLTIRNVGTATFTWSASLATGTAYALAPTNTTLAPGDSGSLAITPSAIPQTSSVANDFYADTLTITTTIAGDAPHVVAVHETARGAILTTATTDVPFGGVRIDTTGTAQLSVTNAGNVATNLSFVLGAPNGPFAFAPQGGSVAAGGNATITASFTPTATTTYSDSASFAVSNGTPLCGPLPAAISVRGTGTNGAPTISPTNLDFSLVPCGSQASAQNVGVENTGTASFGFTAALTSGASYYTLGATSGSVAPGDTFNLSVTPVAIPASSLTTTDLYAGAITITTDVVGDTPHVVSLHETALGARLSIDVAHLDFGPVTIGQSKDLPFKVTNDGNAAADVSYAGFTSPPVSVAPAGPVAGGASLAVTATFTPQDGSALDQSLALQTSSGLCLPLPAAIPMTGSGM